MNVVEPDPTALDARGKAALLLLIFIPLLWAVDKLIERYYLKQRMKNGRS